MSALLLLVACLVLGALVARIGHPPAGLAQGLNWWVINIAFAALVVHVIPTVRFDWQYWFLAAALWLVFLARGPCSRRSAARCTGRERASVR